MPHCALGKDFPSIRVREVRWWGKSVRWGLGGRSPRGSHAGHQPWAGCGLSSSLIPLSGTRWAPAAPLGSPLPWKPRVSLAAGEALGTGEQLAFPPFSSCICFFDLFPGLAFPTGRVRSRLRQRFTREWGRDEAWPALGWSPQLINRCSSLLWMGWQLEGEDMEGKGDRRRLRWAWSKGPAGNKVLLYLALTLTSVFSLPFRFWQMVDAQRQVSGVPQLPAILQRPTQN